MLSKKENYKPSAELLEDGQIQIKCDAKTVVVRAVKEQDYIDWPKLSKPTAKRGRKKKVVADGDDQGNTEPDS